ncbi:MAG TPA: fatty acyl-AMP ligase [Pseudonocardiaceae bacterium]|nr:fatty acyl-AMP ligase [Pseudonocardiaceae bacterium]
MSLFVQTMLATAGNVAGSTRGITTGEPGAPQREPWPRVHRRARAIAARLVDGGLRPGDAVAVLAGEPALVAPSVQAVWLAGGSVTMLHQPTARTDLAVWARDTVTVLRMIGSRLVLLGAEFEPLSGLLQQHAIPFRTLSSLDGGGPLAEPVPVGEDSTALLQLTSGSTAVPKAVRITHGNLHANMSAMAETARLRAETDVMISWLPLFHDMGMVGFLTLPMTLGIELVKTTPVDFLRAPLLWPDLITRHGGTVTAAPNFAYALVTRRLSTTDSVYDLSTLRLALNGAEPIDPRVARSFAAVGGRFGLPADSVVCAYGMAEATLAVSFAPPGSGLLIDDVDADLLEAHRRAEPASRPGARSFPLLGPPLPGIEVRVVDVDGSPLGTREVGVLQLRGDSVTPGYLTVDGPVPTRDADGWLNTGDEGYVVEDGQVVVCGRVKDVIIMGGRNIYPTDIERAASTVDGVRAGNVVAVRLEAGERRESFAVAVESRLAGDPETERGIRSQVAARVVDAVGVRPLKVVVLPPGTLPKTPSGKLRRTATRTLIDQH